MNKMQPRVEAVAVKGNKIIKVGTTEEVSQLIGKSTKLVHLNRRTVLPGLIDTHIHVADFGRFLIWTDLTDTNSISQMQSLLVQRLKKTQAGKWVVGRGWNESHFAEKRLPTRFDLDAVSAKNPVVFYHQSGQIALVNSKALKLGNVAKQTNAPAGGAIDKNEETGEPTGILRECATDLVWKLIPEPNIDELVERASLACRKIVQAGLTSIHWLAESAVDVAIFKRLLAANKLPLRVYMVIPASLLNNSCLLEGLGEGLAKIGGVEVFADGFLAARTATLFEPYQKNSPNCGTLLCSPEELSDTVKGIVIKGLQVVVHAMGDRAVDAALTAIESLDGKSRCRIDSAAVLNNSLIQRIKKQKVIVSVQPLVAASEFTVYDAQGHLGKERSRWLYPLKTLFNEGICVCGGSDCPMEPLNPLLGVQSAVKRPAYPEEELTVDEALQMYTVNAAQASCEEKLKGTIEEGKLADFTVLSQDPHQVQISRLPEIIVEMTIIDGKVVYSR
jgi:predicted amidohydrolase YtcJ